MTSSIWLGTALDLQAVYSAAEACDFERNVLRGSCGILYVHQGVEDLRLQIASNTRMFLELERILTSIEFDDMTGLFPDRPSAVEVLRQLYGSMPDLVCRDPVFFSEDLKPILPLSEYLIKLEKKEIK